MEPDSKNELRLCQLKQQFEELLKRETRLHQPGVREAYRPELDRLLSQAPEVIESTRPGDDEDKKLWVQTARLLVRAYASRSEAARYGAGQLSRSAQRAPTLKDCNAGWRQVAVIAQDARAAADSAQPLAQELGNFRSLAFAQRAKAAAESAAQIVAERNQAYTFHTLPEFSFGEGWYVAAAALLHQISVQVWPGTPQEQQAHAFLQAAGLARRLQPYRSRPANPKQLTALIAESFAASASSAQTQLRSAFLGAAHPPETLCAWVQAKLNAAPQQDKQGELPPTSPLKQEQKVLLWVRISGHDPHRNTSFAELAQLAQLLVDAGITPIYFGDQIPEDALMPPGVDLTLCWKEPLFQGLDQRRAQLHLFEVLRQKHELIAQIGVTTAGMDGPALMGLPTFYLTDEPNLRMGQWVGRVPGYQEVVRTPGYQSALISALVSLSPCSADKTAP